MEREALAERNGDLEMEREALAERRISGRQPADRQSRRSSRPVIVALAYRRPARSRMSKIRMTKPSPLLG
jgi:hypothetical protein